MKKNTLVIPSLVALAATASSASAQGLLDVSPTSGETGSLPLTFTAGVETGWDSNVNNSSNNEVDSLFTAGNLGMEYSSVTERTSVALGVKGGVFYYFDQAPGIDDTLYNARVNFAFSHAVSDRLRISNRSYYSYEFEPDYVIGESLSRRADQYNYGYTSFNVGYSLTERVYSSTDLTVSGITYDQSLVSFSEDRLTYGVGESLRYAVDENFGLDATYRWSLTDYDNGAETQSHYALVGFDYAADENTDIVARVGAQFRLSDDYGDKTSPYFEGALTHDVSEVTTFSWLHRLGYEESDLNALTTSRYAYRTSASLSRSLTEKLTGSTGLVYSYADFDGAASRTDNLVSARFGVNYALTQAFTVGANYSFNMVDSDDALRDYDRHRVSLNLGATF
ncbi:outer membrane beta-barrel protein [Sulfuriroseicoccus oceanibius]|uniref:Outer membrane beta-barrel protein n=1 Tax=Sulfuriroseicoccus oceanibius TaxID=2707525 RepID=A0A6B3L8R5_9BACT|nr:outer membrane beta-barrel protein [Sulfuriroseicoccus oceanibius]QQL45795.1 outer membrane beta-barrel protein [Sulfuriroseicoccus oceanibius]